MEPSPNEFRASTESGQNNFASNEQGQGQPGELDEARSRMGLIQNAQLGAERSFLNPEQNLDSGFYTVDSLQQQGSMPPLPASAAAAAAQWQYRQSLNPQLNPQIPGPYTAAMQMERNLSTRTRTVLHQPDQNTGDAQAHPASTAQTQSFASPARQTNIQMLDPSRYPTISVVQPQYYDPQMLAAQQYRQGYYYPPPQLLPTVVIPADRPYTATQQAYTTLGYPPQNPYYPRQERPHFPYTEALYSSEQRDNPYWQSIDGADLESRARQVAQAGATESLSFIRNVNNNDVLCGRGGATNSHIGNRSFREIVKQYKDRYLKAKKKEKPNVAGEIVDKIRNLEPNGRFLRKDRDTGCWVDIGDVRAKEKTSQALREGAPLIRKKMLEGEIEEDMESEEGASPEKSVASGTILAASSEIEEEAKRNIHSSSPDQEKSSVIKHQDDSPSSKRRKRNLDERGDDMESGDEKDDDNASNDSAPVAPSPRSNNNNQTSGGEDSPDSKKGKEGGGGDHKPVTPSKRKMNKVNESDLTQSERDLYLSVFDPPRAPPKQGSIKEEDEDETDNVRKI
mmetsp:Transcript_177/g.183  ORF Transcript_177/g.183 Transcript_177/m.183 type:complete len:566 (+) Transcript_177:185-1882(+)